MKKPKTVWVTQDIDDEGYEIWSRKPKWMEAERWWGGTNLGLEGFCPERFETYTNIKLKPGKTGIIKGHFNFVRER